MKTIFLTFLISCIFFDSCKKIDNNLIDTTPKLPEATQEGKNTFGCYINSELWLPGKHLGEPYIYEKYNSKNGNFSIKAGGDGSIDIVIDNLFDERIYTLSDTLSKAFLFLEEKGYELENITTDTCIVEITKLDTINKIISGLFEIYFKDTNKEIITITDGRFDVKY